MTTQEIQHLTAEQSFLKQRLQEIPVTARISRMSTEARLRTIEEALAAVPSNGVEPARVRLTFSGRPVVGSYGVFAEFGTKATSAFNDLVAKVAASLSGPLAALGPVPNRDQAQLLITSTVPGSFGFELEEYRPGELPFDDSPAAQALELTQSLLQSTEGTDDELADAVSATDPRAVAAARGFLEVLATNDAICALEHRGRHFRFKDVGAIRTGLARLAQDNLHEDEEDLFGEFLGVLPESRRFEFKLTDDTVIRGKLGPGVSAADDLNSHLHQPVSIKTLVTRVGNGKPRYVILEQPEWLAPEA